MDETQLLSARLVQLLEREVDGADAVRIENLQRAGAGSSTENWLFDASWSVHGQSHHEALVLRRAPASEVVVASRTTEFALLQALANRGIPAPRAWWMDHDGSLFGRPAMVLQRCTGRADRQMLTGRNAAGLGVPARTALAAQMVDVLCAIHAIPVAALRAQWGEVAARGVTARQAILNCEAGFLPLETVPSPEMRLAAWWLRDHLPALPGREVLVHGDFRPANLLVEGGHLSAVLDWELAHCGDPAQDLGWYLAPVYRAEHFIAGSWTPRDYLQRYESRTGTTVDRQALRFWSVFALFQLAGIAIATAHGFLHGDATRLLLFPHPLMAQLMRAISDDVDFQDLL